MQAPLPLPYPHPPLPLPYPAPLPYPQPYPAPVPSHIAWRSLISSRILSASSWEMVPFSTFSSRICSLTLSRSSLNSSSFPASAAIIP
ncbi:hypothetical protein D3Z36_11180 [Lachnospiraceae bacterium]|nr:hypothetical protein [Lachnospiraceae bacterium]